MAIQYSRVGICLLFFIIYLVKKINFLNLIWLYLTYFVHIIYHKAKQTSLKKNLKGIDNMKDLMVVSYKGYRFEKLDTGSIINVYNESTGKEVYSFTHYDLKDNYKQFRKYCIEIYTEMVEELNTY